MKNYIRTFVSTCLVLALVIGCTACGSGSKATSTSTAAAATAPVEEKEAETEGAAEVAEKAGSSESSYPQMTITINCHKAGTNLDYAARALSVFCEDYYGTNMIVNNTSGIVDSLRDTMNAEADGYSLCVANNSALVSQAMGSVEFSVVDDMTLIAMLGHNCANWIGITTEFADANNIKSLEDLFAYTQEHPGELIISDKVGTNTNVVVEMLIAAGLDVTAADCGQGSDRVANFLSGACDIFLGPYSSISQYCEQGDVICLASCSSERSEYSPDIPCTYEMGYEIECQSWYFICGPKGLPDDVVNAVNALVEAAMEDETFVASCESFEATPIYMNASETTEFLTAELARMETLNLGQ